VSAVGNERGLEKTWKESCLEKHRALKQMDQSKLSTTQVQLILDHLDNNTNPKSRISAGSFNGNFTSEAIGQGKGGTVYKIHFSESENFKNNLAVKVTNKQGPPNTSEK